MAPMEKNALHDHVFQTYISLRYGAVVIGVLLPILVYLLGAARGVPLAPSISDYY
jgi:hypothetical protein